MSLCLQCNNPITFNKYDYRKKFCNHTCAATFNNKTRCRYTCKTCAKPTHRNTDFCCVKCKEDYLLKAWLNHQESGGTKYGYVRAFVRRYLEDRANHSCEHCGFNTVRPCDGLSILQVDHINGDCTNSSINNLRLLCPNCHAMTPTYCGKNKNSGRSWKKKYRSKLG